MLSPNTVLGDLMQITTSVTIQNTSLRCPECGREFQSEEGARLTSSIISQLSADAPSVTADRHPQIELLHERTMELRQNVPETGVRCLNSVLSFVLELQM